MHIILDTNIYQSNFSMQGTRFQALRAYLEKSDDRLIIPYIVCEELKINYQAALKKSLKELQRANREFRNISISKEQVLVSQSVGKQIGLQLEAYEEVSNDYVDHVQRNIGRIRKLDMGIYDHNYITGKSLRKEPPFNENGSGFKDTLIWLDVLSYCSTREEKQLIFISNNSRDFGKDGLHPELKSEAENKGLTIHFYNNLEGFIDDRFKSIENIELQPENVDQKTLQILTGLWLDQDPQSTRSFLNFKSTSRKRYIDYVGVHSIEVKEIKEFVVKDVAPDYKYIHGTMECLAGLAAATIHISYDGSEVEHQTSIEEVKTDILVIFSMKYLEGIFDDLEVVEILFP